MEAADLTLTGSFDCGIAVLNEWLQRYAWQNHQSGGARVYLTVESRRKLIGGYYCLSAAQADYGEASQRVSKGLSRNPIPIVLIGRFAIHSRFQGSGLGRFLMQDAFRRIVSIGDSIGVRAIMVRAKDDSAADFYCRLGFQSSASDPKLLFHLLKDVKKSLAAAHSR